MSDQSLIYSHRALYHAIMRLLYGRHFEARYAAIAAEIPDSVEVIDVCAGDSYLYLKYLRSKHVNYLALDISPQLIAWAQRHGVPARQFDARRDELPIGDVLVMQASLYQFLPDAAPMIRKLLNAARQRVIITEPIRNLSDSKNPLLAFIGRKLTVPVTTDGTYAAQRFTPSSAGQLFRSFESLDRLTLLPGGREMLGVFRGQAAHDHAGH